MKRFNAERPVYLLPLLPTNIAVYHLLKKNGIQVTGFCDNSRRYAGAEYLGTPCVTPNEAAAAHPDALFIIGCNHGQVRRELSAQLREKGCEVMLLEQILEHGDIPSILDDIDEASASALFRMQSIRDFVELRQHYHLLPDNRPAESKIIDTVYLYSYRDIWQDFEELTLPGDFIRRIYIFSRGNEELTGAIQKLLQSDRFIGTIEICRDLNADKSIVAPEKWPFAHVPLYVVVRQQSILRRENAGETTPVVYLLDSEYPAVFDEKKTIFIHIPKNSGSALREYLFGYSMEFTHVPARFYRNADAEKFGEYFSFALARNPWSRLVSGYTYCRENYLHVGVVDSFRKLCATVSFKEMVYALRDDEEGLLRRHAMISPQYEWVCDENGRVIVDYIGRVESSNESYAHIAEKINVQPYVSKARINASKHKPYQEYYDDETREIVRELFKTDIELFGYEFD